MIDIGLEALLIMDKAGIPLLFQKLDPKRSDIEPILLSGFLTAVKAFSMEIIDDTISDFHVDYGKRLITILSGHKIVFAAIHNHKSTERIIPVLSPLLKEFESQYYTEEHIGDSGPLDKYEPFRERIATVMGISNPSLDWIPFFANLDEVNVTDGSEVRKLINNHYSIKDIVKYSNLSEPEVLDELSKLWAIGVIRFRNILTQGDIVISTSKIASYLQPNTIEWRELGEVYPNLISIIPHILNHLDGRTTVGQILEDVESEGIENVFWLMDFLYISDALSILSPEKRRILMAKEILQKSLEIAADIYSVKETIWHLKSVLNEIRSPEIISQIRLSEEKWTIDYSFLVYEGLTPEKVLHLYDVWLEILRMFIFSLDEKKRKKYIEQLTEELNFDFFEKYRSEDMDGFEEFAFWLELIFI